VRMYCIHSLLPDFSNDSECGSEPFSRVPRPLPVTSRLVFENQTILSRGAMRSLADFEHKAGWVAGHHGRTTVRQVSDKGASYVVGFSDVDPLTSVRESVDARSSRCEHPDARLRKRSWNMLLERHPLSLIPDCQTSHSVPFVGFVPMAASVDNRRRSTTCLPRAISAALAL
jgi:hypothetical protein